MIRKYTPQDADTVVSVWRQASAVAHPFLSDDFIDSEADALRNVYLGFAETWVSEVDGTVVGFIALIEDEIAGLFLNPAHHKLGLGRELVEFAVALKGPLRVEVFEKNGIGRRFYDSCGFAGSESFVHEATGEQVLKLALAAA